MRNEMREIISKCLVILLTVCIVLGLIFFTIILLTPIPPKNETPAPYTYTTTIALPNNIILTINLTLTNVTKEEVDNFVKNNTGWIAEEMAKNLSERFNLETLIVKYPSNTDDNVPVYLFATHYSWKEWYWVTYTGLKPIPTWIEIPKFS